MGRSVGESVLAPEAPNERWDAGRIPRSGTPIPHPLSPIPQLGHVVEAVLSRPASLAPAAGKSRNVSRPGRGRGCGEPAAIVKDEFDAFLEYGIPARAFLRVRCAACSHEKRWLFPASCAAYAPRAEQGAWRELPPGWSIMPSPKYRCASGCCRFPIPLREPLRGASGSARSSIADRAPGDRDASDQAGRLRTQRSRHRRGHPHPALRICRQFEHTPA